MLILQNSAKCAIICNMNILRFFIDLYRKNRQLALLSIVYGLIAIVFVFIAGIFALINQSVGIAILIVPLIAIAALSANIVAWALINLAFDCIAKKLDELEKKQEKSQARKSSK